MISPKTVSIELTNNCNFQCKFCWARTSNRPRGFMSKELFDKIVKELETMGSVNICISFAGESTLHPDFGYFCEQIRKFPVKNIITNGSMLKKVGKDIIENGINVTVSINDVGESYEKFCGYPYSNIKDNIQYLLSLRGTKKFPNITVAGHAWAGQDFEKFKSEWIGKVDRVFVTAGIENMEWKYFVDGMDLIKQNTCIYPERYIAILCDARVTMCCRDIAAEMAFGSLKRNTIMQIFNGLEYTRIRDMFKSGIIDDGIFCKKCKLWQYVPKDLYF